MSLIRAEHFCQMSVMEQQRARREIKTVDHESKLVRKAESISMWRWDSEEMSMSFHIIFWKAIEQCLSTFKIHISHCPALEIYLLDVILHTCKWVCEDVHYSPYNFLVGAGISTCMCTPWEDHISLAAALPLSGVRGGLLSYWQWEHLFWPQLCKLEGTAIRTGPFSLMRVQSTLGVSILHF